MNPERDRRLDARASCHEVEGLRYLDRFERRGGLWRIAQRTCVWDYSYIVPIRDKWPLGPGFRLGRPGREDPSYAR